MKPSDINKPHRVIICIPCRDSLHSMFAYNLVQLIQTCNINSIKVSVIMELGSLISQQRQKLAEAALRQGATHIMWLDSDMLFPVNIVETLLNHDCDIAACNYSTRSVPLKGVAYKTLGDWNSWLGYGGEVDRLVEVEGVGMGCMLVKADVYRNLSKPWFDVSWNDELGDHIGEDFYFCVKAREAGYKVMIDMLMSREIRHLGTTRFDLARAVR